MFGKCQMEDGLGMTMAIFFQSRQKKETDPESMLWLEKFAHSAYIKAGLNFFPLGGKSATKNLSIKSRDLIGD
jgi:hypothetical protein